MNRESPTSSPAVQGGEGLGYEAGDDNDLDEALPTASLSLNYIYLQASEERVVDFSEAGRFSGSDNASGSHAGASPGDTVGSGASQEPLPSSVASNSGIDVDSDDEIDFMAQASSSPIRKKMPQHYDPIMPTASVSSEPSTVYSHASESSWDIQRIEVPLNSSTWRQSTSGQASSTWQPAADQGSSAAAWMTAGAYNRGSGAVGAASLSRLPAAGNPVGLTANNASQESTSSGLRHPGSYRPDVVDIVRGSSGDGNGEINFPIPESEAATEASYEAGWLRVANNTPTRQTNSSMIDHGHNLATVPGASRHSHDNSLVTVPGTSRQSHDNRLVTVPGTSRHSHDNSLVTIPGTSRHSHDNSLVTVPGTSRHSHDNSLVTVPGTSRHSHDNHTEVNLTAASVTIKGKSRAAHRASKFFQDNQHGQPSASVPGLARNSENLGRGNSYLRNSYLSSSVQLHLVPSSSPSSSSIYPYRDQQLNNQPANLSLYSQHRTADDYPAASSSQSSSVTVYPHQPSNHHQIIDSISPSAHNSVSVYPQRRDIPSSGHGVAVSLYSASSSSSSGSSYSQRHPDISISRVVTSSSSQHRINRSTLENGETLHLGDVSITRATTTGNQRPTRMDGLMSNESSHSAATVRAVSIASVPGTSRSSSAPSSAVSVTLSPAVRSNYSSPAMSPVRAADLSIARPSVSVEHSRGSSSRNECESVSIEPSIVGPSVSLQPSISAPIVSLEPNVGVALPLPRVDIENNINLPSVVAVEGSSVRPDVNAAMASVSLQSQRAVNIEPSVSLDLAVPGPSSDAVAIPGGSRGQYRIDSSASLAGPSVGAASSSAGRGGGSSSLPGTVSPSVEMDFIEARAGPSSRPVSDNPILVDLQNSDLEDEAPGSSRQQGGQAKRSINFPDSHFFRAKRSRLLDDCVRPDSPSDQNPLNDNAHRTISRRSTVEINVGEEIVPDDDCDNEPVVSAPHDLDVDIDDAVDRPSSQSDYFHVADGGAGPIPGSSRGNHRASVEVLSVSEGSEMRGARAPESRYHARVGSTDFIAPSPAESSDREWDASDLVSGSDMSSRVNITSRRTLSESSEAEGTVTYNRELFLPGLGQAGHLPRGGEHSQHVSPTGSEVSEAGPSNRSHYHRSSSSARQPTPASPTGSDVSEAGPSNYRAGRHSARQPTPASPTGSDVSEAGTSGYHHGGGARGGGGLLQAVVGSAGGRQPTPASPTESDVSAAESTSQNRVTDHSNPNSPSGSEIDEPGPSHGGFGAVGGGGGHPHQYGGAPGPSWQHQGHRQGFREAAPAPRRYSPEPYRYNRSRARYSDQCVISSSTGPADSNPPTPEYDHSGDIDNEVLSPPEIVGRGFAAGSSSSSSNNRRYMGDEGDNVVDSTVDSTSGNFIIPSPIYRGNEAEHEGDSDSDMNDSESIPGSEASSTTASIHDHNFYMPGFDDNEGISTSGQVDEGNFRLVPNDDRDLDEMVPGAAQDEGSGARHNQQADPVPDVQASVSSDESIGQLSDQGEADPQQPHGPAVPVPGPSGQKPPFKRPMMNRKGRLLQSYHEDGIGPSLEMNDAAIANATMEMVVDGAMVNPELMNGNAAVAGSSREVGEAEGSSSAAEVIPGPSGSGGRNYSGGSRHSAMSLFSQGSVSLTLISSDQFGSSGNSVNALPSTSSSTDNYSAGPSTATAAVSLRPLGSSEARTGSSLTADSVGSSKNAVSMLTIGTNEANPRTGSSAVDSCSSGRPAAIGQSGLRNVTSQSNAGQSSWNVTSQLSTTGQSGASNISLQSAAGQSGTRNVTSQSYAGQSGACSSSGTFSGAGPSVSLFNLASSQGNGLNGVSSNTGSGNNTKLADFLSSSNYAESLGIGHAFSGLPSSLTDPWEQETNSKEDKSLTGPLAKRIKTKHMQEIALSGSVTLTPSVSNPVAVEQDNMASAGPSSVSSHQSSSQQEQPGIQQGSSSHHQESQELSDQQGTSPNPIAGSSSQAKKSAKPSTSQPERQQSVAEEIRLPPLGDDNQLSIAQQQGGATDDNAEPTTESQLGGTQQSFNLRIEHNNINLLESKHSNINLLEPKNDSINNMLNSKQENLNNLLGLNKAHSRHTKQNCDKAASDYRELFDFDSSSFDAKNGDDLPHSITDAINEVDINDDEEEPSELFNTKTKPVTANNESDSDLFINISAQNKLQGPKNVSINDNLRDDILDEVHIKIELDKASDVPETLDHNSNNDSHMMSDTPSAPPLYPCKYCDKTFQRKTSLTTHVRVHKGFKKYVCDICQQKFGQASTLRAHKREKHGENAVNPEGSADLVTCQQCRLQFSSAMLLKIHQFSHNPHKEKQNWSVEDALAHYRGGQVPGEEWLQEDAAGQELDQLQVANNNLAQEIGGMRFQCPSEECRDQFDIWLDLVDHVTQTHSTYSVQAENHKCGLCYKVFSTEERLEKHMRVHVKDESKPLKCNTCGKGFLTNSALAGHAKSHSNIQFDCPICLRKFMTMSQLKDHVYEHKENGVFTCPYCKKIFTEYQPIRKHIRSYHINKTIKCKVCKENFSSQDKLRQHEATHLIKMESLEYREENSSQEIISLGESSSSSSGNNTMHANGNSSTGINLSESNGNVIKSLSFVGNNSSNSSFEAGNISLESGNSSFDGNEVDFGNVATEQVKKSAGEENPLAQSIPTAANSNITATKSTVPNVAATSPELERDAAVNWHRFPFKCSLCKLGFKRRGMLVNHLAKRHPDLELSEIPELNEPIVRADKDFYCQYCPKIYKSSSKRKGHILKKHPGQPLPASVRNVHSDDAAYALAVGRKSSLPYSCSACHKQYVDKAKLFDHQRKDHLAMLREPELPVDNDSASTSKVYTPPVSQQSYEDAASVSGPSYRQEEGELLTINTAELRNEVPEQQLSDKSATFSLRHLSLQ